MEQQIKITLEPVYGRMIAHPACEHARLFAELAGTRTLTDQALRTIGRLGYEVIALDAFGQPAGALVWR